MKKWNITGWQRVMLAIIAGVLVGTVWHEEAEWLGCLGTIFLGAIKMVMVPLIFFAIIYGITSVQNNVAKTSAKAIVLFLSTAMLAALIGIVVTKSWQMWQSELSLETVRALLLAQDVQVSDPNHFLKIVIPDNIVAAAASGYVLQVVIFAFLCGSVMQKYREDYPGLVGVCREAAQLFFRIIEKIMFFAPLGVFGYIASIVGRNGTTALMGLSHLLACITCACLLQYLVFAIAIMTFCRVSPRPFFSKLLEIQLLAFSTSSSKAVLVPLMEVAERRLGISQQSSRFVLPLSAALNMDGGAIYQASCAIFFCQLLHIDLSLLGYVTVILMSTLASIGGAGVPGGVLLFLGMVFQSIGVPVEAVMVVATIDRIADMLTTAVNVTGDACVTMVVDKSNGSFSRDIYYSE